VAYVNPSSSLRDWELAQLTEGPTGARGQLRLKAWASAESIGSTTSVVYYPARFDNKGKPGWILNMRRRANFNSTENLCLSEDVIASFPNLTDEFTLPEAIRQKITEYCQKHKLSESFKS